MKRRIFALMTTLGLMVGLFVLMAVPAMAWHADITGDCDSWTIHPSQHTGWSTIVNGQSPDEHGNVVIVDKSGATERSFNVQWILDSDGTTEHPESGSYSGSRDLSGCDGDKDKVLICHRTAATTNPYQMIEVAREAVDGRDKGDHYLEHQGPIFPATGDDGKWGDIIPPVDGFHDGLNWTTEGQAILNNGCEIPDDPEPSVDYGVMTESSCDVPLAVEARATVEGWEPGDETSVYEGNVSVDGKEVAVILIDGDNTFHLVYEDPTFPYGASALVDVQFFIDGELSSVYTKTLTRPTEVECNPTTTEPPAETTTTTTEPPAETTTTSPPAETTTTTIPEVETDLADDQNTFPTGLVMLVVASVAGLGTLALKRARES